MRACLSWRGNNRHFVHFVWPLLWDRICCRHHTIRNSVEVECHRRMRRFVYLPPKTDVVCVSRLEMLLSSCLYFSCHFKSTDITIANSPSAWIKHDVQSYPWRCDALYRRRTVEDPVVSSIRPWTNISPRGRIRILAYSPWNSNVFTIPAPIHSMIRDGPEHMKYTVSSW